LLLLLACLISLFHLSLFTTTETFAASAKVCKSNQTCAFLQRYDWTAETSSFRLIAPDRSELPVAAAAAGNSSTISLVSKRVNTALPILRIKKQRKEKTFSQLFAKS